MIEIKPYMELDGSFAEKSGFEKKTDNTFYMVAKDKDELIGIGKMKVFADFAEICDVYIADEGFKMLAHGIGKSMLNFIERREIYPVICKNENISDLMRLLRFKKVDEITLGGKVEKDVYYVNLKGYFDAKCHNEEN